MGRVLQALRGDEYKHTYDIHTDGGEMMVLIDLAEAIRDQEATNV